MNRNLMAFLVGCSVAGSLHGAAVTPNGFAINRGINISHWISQVPTGEFPHHSVMYTELDAAFLASSGFDHIRLPVDESTLWTEDGQQIDKGWADLEQGIDASLRHGLNVVVDLHIVRSHYFNAANEGASNSLFTDEGAQEHFLDLWRQLSEHLQHYPVDRVAYEYLNEAVADDPESWNQLVASVHTLVRGLEPNRTVLIGSNLWQQARTFPDLKVPADDPNIILSLHTYAPFLLTHYKASWMPLGHYDGPVSYPGVSVDEEFAKSHFSGDVLQQIEDVGGFKYWDREAIAKDLQPAIEKAKALGLPLYCGEFGSLPAAGRDKRLRYYRDMVSIFVQYDMAYCAWDYRGGFSIIDAQTLQPDHELISILTGNVR